jgi:hypothetical protein
MLSRIINGPTIDADAVTAGSLATACSGLRRFDGINSLLMGSSLPTHSCLLRGCFFSLSQYDVDSYT